MLCLGSWEVGGRFGDARGAVEKAKYEDRDARARAPHQPTFRSVCMVEETKKPPPRLAAREVWWSSVTAVHCVVLCITGALNNK